MLHTISCIHIIRSHFGSSALSSLCAQPGPLPTTPTGRGAMEHTADEPLVCGVDVGGCVGVMNSSHDGHLIYKAVDLGFVAFASLFHRDYGLQNLHIISRTKSGKWKRTKIKRIERKSKK